MLRYAARNAILPNLTGFGMALGFMLSGALLTEMIFSYPGQGFLLLQAVTSQDYPLMQGIFMTITLAVLGANWLVDIAILFLDPRTRKRITIKSIKVASFLVGLLESLAIKRHLLEAALYYFLL